MPGLVESAEKAKKNLTLKGVCGVCGTINVVKVDNDKFGHDDEGKPVDFGAPCRACRRMTIHIPAPKKEDAEKLQEKVFAQTPEQSDKFMPEGPASEHRLKEAQAKEEVPQA